MVSTRQMSTSSGCIANAMSSSVEEGNYLRPSVVTRQSQTIQASVANTLPSSSSLSSVDTLLTSNNQPAADAVGFTNTITTSAATNSLRQTQAFKSYTTANTFGCQMTTMQEQEQQQNGVVKQETERESTINLLDLPVELMDNILSYVGFKKIAQLRMVSHKMNDVCMDILNSTFSKLITKTYNRFQAIKANMPRRESARRKHPLACECDIIETCYMRLSLLQMTFGKHIERGHCCFFPGAILDEVYTILFYIKNTPCVERPFRATDELFDLSTMAMEYFRDRIEPTLPGIAFFNKDFFNVPTITKRPLVIASDLSDSNSSLPSPPQSNMVLRKGIRKIKQGMKIYNNQLSVLRNELRTCKRKSAEQGKQMAEQQKLIAEQRKQTLEYANRMDENDKKNEEMSRKFSTLLQELNKCKTELQYWRSKSPAIPTCISCGHKVTTPQLPAEDYQALVNQGVKPEDIIFNMDDDTDAEESDVSMNDSGCNTMSSLGNSFVFPDETTTAKLLAVNTASKNLKRQHNVTTCIGGGVVNVNIGAAGAAASPPPTTSNLNNANVVEDNNETELTEFIDFNETASSNGPSAFIAAAGYSTRLFYGSPSSSGCTIATSSPSSSLSPTPSPPLSNAAQHKSVIVSPQSQQRFVDIINATKIVENLTNFEQRPEDSGGGGAGGGCGGESIQQRQRHTNEDDSESSASNTEDVNSLLAISSHGTKKARRVQKTARCTTNSSGKRK